MRKRRDIKTNPLYSKFVAKQKIPKATINKKTNLSLFKSINAKNTLKEHPDLILKFRKFIKGERNRFISNNLKFKKLKEPNTYTIETQTNKFLVKEINQTNTKQQWGSHGFNVAFVLSELQKVGINTLTPEFAYTNIKKGESYIAYDYQEMKKLLTIKEAREKKLITEEETKEFKDNINRFYWHFRDKTLKGIEKTNIEKKMLALGFFDESELLFNPMTKSYYVFNPYVDLRKNMLEETRRLLEKRKYFW